MFVQRLQGPERDLIIVKPSWDAIKSAVLRLDNHSFHYLNLDAEQQNPSMTVGGGKAVWCLPGYWIARYHVTCTDVAGNWYLLSDPNIATHYPNEAEITLYLGGQKMNLDADVCVYHEIALQAVETFAVQGKRDVRLHWIKNP